MSPTIDEKNDLYLKKMELTDKYVELHEQLRKELDLASLCISKAKTTHGISLFSVNSYDSLDLEPSVRIHTENGEFELVKEPEKEEKSEEIEEELKNSGKTEEIDENDEENEKKSPYFGQFRPFGVLESSAAKDARKIMKNAITTLLTLATTQQKIVDKTRELTESLSARFSNSAKK